MRAIYLTLEKLIQPEETQVNGIVILADYTGVGMSQASNPGPFLAKKVVSILQVRNRLSDDLMTDFKMKSEKKYYIVFFLECSIYSKFFYFCNDTAVNTSNCANIHDEKTSFLTATLERCLVCVCRRECF